MPKCSKLPPITSRRTKLLSFELEPDGEQQQQHAQVREVFENHTVGRADPEM
jgi:hypothetical protein